MTTERAIRILAGTFILISLALGSPGSPLRADPRWLWLAAFVGANLLQSAFTGFCPAEIVLRRIGVGRARDRAPGGRSDRRAA
jgi:hypothetical protein